MSHLFRSALPNRTFLIVLLAAALVAALPVTASAEGSAARKLGRSLSNVSLGVLAIPGQIMETSEKSGPFVGATWGLVRGIAFMAATEVVGVFELVTCPFETPPGFKPIMKPEFPWQYFIERR